MPQRASPRPYMLDSTMQRGTGLPCSTVSWKVLFLCVANAACVSQLSAECTVTWGVPAWVMLHHLRVTISQGPSDTLRVCSP